jgi:ubiquinone/menaquinone biosynthesis C-methylase UbiE
VSLYGRLFAHFYDRSMARSEAAGLARLRHDLLAQARGRVLEIGAGTGINLPHYPAGVSELVLSEPEEPMLRRLQARIAAHTTPPASATQVAAETLPFADGSFDTAVTTLALCTVDDLPRALAELRRVLAPGGRLLFLEHVRSEDECWARRQDRLHRVWKRIGHGCHCNRATLTAIQSASFDIERVERGPFPNAPRLVQPLIWGAATPS